MEITGIQVIPASRTAVWQALSDPAVLKACLPGCESVELTGPEEFRVIVATAIGPLRARFRGVLRMTQALPPNSCVMVFEGQGGPIGFGKGTSSVTLGELGASTELRYSANAELGGKLAQIGSRMIDGVAKKMADDFFAAFRNAVRPPEVLDVPEVAGSAATRSLENGMSISGNELASQSPASAAVAGLTRKDSVSTGAIMVPGWWLAVASAIGAATAIASVLLVR